MHILVTGGCGFIGSHIIDSLLKKNHYVRCFDNLSSGNISNIQHNINNKNFEFINGDVCNLNEVKKACQNIDIICHQTAIASVQKSIDAPIDTHNVNVTGFLNVLMTAKECNIKRIVYASSAAVYGDSSNTLQVEDQIGSAISPYGLSKYIDELYAHMFSKLYNLECVGLRYFNVFGPRQDPNGGYAAVIPKFICQIINDDIPIIFGDGSYSRDFVYIDNIVEANMLAMFNDNINGSNIVNIASGEVKTILETFNIIKRKLNKNIEPIFKENRAGDIACSSADIAKAHDLLNYKPIVLFETGIIKTVEYFKNKN